MATSRFLPLAARQAQQVNALRNGQQGDPDGSIARAEAARFARTAPNKADAAPKPTPSSVGTGLMAALNNFQQSLVDNGTYEVADIYEIKFVEPLIASSTVVPPGNLEKDYAANTPVQNSGQQLLPEKQSIDPKARLRSVARGQSIVQFIDQVIRSSSWISDQAGVYWEPYSQSWELNGIPADLFVWFNIDCVAEQLRYDNKRNDFAYRLTYVITPYQVPMKSDYFYPSKVRGSHKIYNYWYTGQNTQVLNYEQNFNYLWTQVIADADLPAKLRQQNNPTEQWKRAYLPASGQSRQGASEKQFEPGANAADFLYSSDLAEVQLTVVGDPAWIPSIQPGYTGGGFTTSAFYPDGQINYSASAPYFTIAWNKPVDYELSTGIMDTGAANDLSNRRNGFAGIAAQSYLYQAISSKSSFKQGKFTQELEGKWILEQTADTNTNTSSSTANQYQSEAETQRLIRQQADAQARTANEARRAFAETDPRRVDINNRVPRANVNIQSSAIPSIRPAGAPGTPTSNGGISPFVANRTSAPSGSVGNLNPGNQSMAHEE